MEDLAWQFPAEAVERAAVRFCEAIARWRGKPELETVHLPAFFSMELCTDHLVSRSTSQRPGSLAPVTKANPLLLTVPDLPALEPCRSSRWCIRILRARRCLPCRLPRLLGRQMPTIAVGQLSNNTSRHHRTSRFMEGRGDEKSLIEGMRCGGRRCHRLRSGDGYGFHFLIMGMDESFDWTYVHWLSLLCGQSWCYSIQSC